MRLLRLLGVWLFILVLLSTSSLASEKSPLTEIQHLLDFISESGCRFQRNGSEYSAADAREHIEMKYDYVRKKINSAEDFITYAASRSSLSGRLYMVNCGGGWQSSQDWLLDELRRFREKR